MPPAFLTTDDGDVILRAGTEPSPKHDFRVHKFILSLASSVFKDMFTFPQPPDQSHNREPNIPTVDVPDSPEVLDTILRFIYPGVEPPTFPDLSTVSTLLSAADKYNISSMRPVLRNALKPFMDAEPFRVYIVASQFGFVEEAKATAKALTQKTAILPSEHEKDIRCISSADLYRLQWFLETRGVQARMEIQNSTRLVAEWYSYPCTRHWGTGFYTRLGEVLRDTFTRKPSQFDDLNGLMGMIPDPPPGCAPGHPSEEIDCPLRPSFIRNHLAVIATRLDGINDALLKKAFEKEF